MVNSYFHIVLKYGDKFEVLSFADLIEVDAREGDVDVKLKGLEYDLTRTIRKVSQEFGNIESMLARLPKDVTLTAYITPSTVPDDLKDLPDRIRKVGADLTQAGKGRFTFQEVDPSTDKALAEKIYTDYGVQPYALDILSRRTFYCHMVITMGDKVERVFPRTALTEADLRKNLEAAIRRLTPGQLKTVGIFTEKPEPPKQDPRMPQQQPTPQPDYQVLEKVLSTDYEVQRLDLADGQVPDHVQVLVVGKAGKLQDKQAYAIDQFLMKGGAILALVGDRTIGIDRTGLQAKATDRSFANLIAKWGVTVEKSMVQDPQDASFPVPAKEKRGPFVMERIKLLPYPFFPDIRQDGMAEGNPALSGLNNVTLPWSSPLVVASDLPDRTADVLLHSSDGTWLRDDGKIDPDFTKYPKEGFGAEGEQKARDLAVALTGTFPSTFADKPSPLDEDMGVDADRTGRTLKKSLPGARLVVIGTGEFVSDLMMSLAQQSSGEVHRGNLQLVQNLVDWSVEDTDLLQIRTSGAFARTLKPMEAAARTKWEIGNYLVVLGALMAVAVFSRRRSRGAIPIPLGKATEVRS